MNTPHINSVKLRIKGVFPRRFGTHANRIISVTTGHQLWTQLPVARELADRGVRHDRWSYQRLFNTLFLPPAAYIFTDFDRLSPWHVELAARIYLQLKGEGLPVFNDPRNHMPRWAQLRHWHKKGINNFTCWLPMLGEMPERYPAFLRTVNSHRGVESGLLHNEADAAKALHDALAKGLTLQDLVFIEFAAEPAKGSDRYRKYAAYRVGSKVVRSLAVTEDNWVAKMGSLGSATDEHYAADLVEHENYPRVDFINRGFEAVGLEFGRIDYGFVDGKPQIYELNTNPMMAWGGAHPNKDRRSANVIVRRQYCDAMQTISHAPDRPRLNAIFTIPRPMTRASNFRQP